MFASNPRFGKVRQKLKDHFQLYFKPKASVNQIKPCLSHSSEKYCPCTHKYKDINNESFSCTAMDPDVSLSSIDLDFTMASGVTIYNRLFLSSFTFSILSPFIMFRLFCFFSSSISSPCPCTLQWLLLKAGSCGWKSSEQPPLFMSCLVSG